jgi:hypothetical protein
MMRKHESSAKSERVLMVFDDDKSSAKLSQRGGKGPGGRRKSTDGC